MVTVNVVTIAISGALFIFGLFIGRVTHSTKTAESATPSDIPQITPTQQMSPLPTNTVEPTVYSRPTSVPTEIPQTPTRKVSSSWALTGFIYPASTISLQTDTQLVLKSNNDATQITDWYESKLQEFSSRSQAKTNSNGHILNKLAGNKDGRQITITIEKQSNSSNVDIRVTSTEKSSDSSVHIEIRNNSTNISE